MEHTRQLVWCEVRREECPADAPRWMFASAMDEFGKVFIPAAVCGNENEAIMCAAYDGATIVYDRRHGHAYVDADWMRREFGHRREVVDLCDLIQRRTREHFAFPPPR